MKINSDASVLHLTHESIANFTSLSNFDKKSIEKLPSFCKKSIPAIEEDATNSITVEASTTGAKMSPILVSRLLKAVNDHNCYGSIYRLITPKNFGYESVFAIFKIECKAYLSAKDDDDSKAPKINKIDNNRKIFC